MTTDTERRDQFATALHRIAELIEHGDLPLPTVATSLSWYPGGADAREQATAIAAALGGQWQADRHAGGDYLHASAVLTPGDGYSGVLRVHLAVEHKRPEVPTPPAEAFAVELTAAAEVTA